MATAISNEDSARPAVGQQVITAVAFIHATIDGVKKVFLAKRADSKAFLPGLYELPGGHIDFGEECVAGLKRELREELQVDVAVGDPFDVFTYLNAVKGSHSIEVVYFAAFDENTPDIKLDPHNHSTWGWFSRSDLETIKAQKVAPKSHTGSSEEFDPEWLVIQKGFDILEGAPFNFGM